MNPPFNAPEGYSWFFGMDRKWRLMRSTSGGDAKGVRRLPPGHHLNLDERLFLLDAPPWEELEDLLANLPLEK